MMNQACIWALLVLLFIGPRLHPSSVDNRSCTNFIYWSTLAASHTNCIVCNKNVENFQKKFSTFFFFKGAFLFWVGKLRILCNIKEHSFFESSKPINYSTDGSKVAYYGIMACFTWGCSRSRVEWNRAILLDESHKLDGWPLDEDPTPKSGKWSPKHTCHHLEGKIN
jgi:hypothetical protein